MKTLVAATILAVGLTPVLNAQTEPGNRGNRNGRPCPEIRDVRTENHKMRREHRRTQRSENKAFREGLADVPEGERIDRMIAHRQTQHGENKALHEELHGRLVAAIEACEDMPADKKQEILGRIAEHHQEAVAFHAQIHADVIAFLDKLKNSDDTPEEKAQAWRAFRDEIRERIEAWHRQHRPRRDPERGRRGEQGGRQGERQGRRGSRDQAPDKDADGLLDLF